MRLSKQQVINKLFALAHQNDVSVSRLLERIEETFTVTTDHLPRDEDGSFKYANGDYGIELDLDDAVIQALQEEAFKENTTMNAIINRALEQRINELDIKA